jgi:hypothetical protein
MLTRYWFRTSGSRGYGVTGYSLKDAEDLLREFGYPASGDSFIEVVENVDVQTLDQSHVVPNIGPVNFRGIWFPRHNV